MYYKKSNAIIIKKKKKKKREDNTWKRGSKLFRQSLFKQDFFFYAGCLSNMINKYSKSERFKEPHHEAAKEISWLRRLLYTLPINLKRIFLFFFGGGGGLNV